MRSWLKEVLIALVVGGFAYAVSCALVWPQSLAVGFGIQWQSMSERPFDLVGQFPHRWLAPLLAWLFGLGGENFVVFVRGFSVLLLATIFFFSRTRGARVLDGVLVTLAVAVISPIQMYKEAWLGYPDAMCYTLFFWAMMAAKRPLVFWGLFFVNLSNHELAVFMLPWLWFVRRQTDTHWRIDLVGVGCALSAYATFYLVVRAKAQALFTADYFMAHPLFPGGSLVTWSLALVHYVVAFGPILAVLAWFMHTRAHGRERWHFGLVACGIVAIFCIAFDWARHSHLMVIPLVLAMTRFLAAGHRVIFVGLMVLGAGLMTMPVCRPWAAKTWPTHAILDPALDTGVVILRFTPNELDVTFGPLSTALTGWLPAAWPTLWPVLAILAAIWLAGALFARFRPAAVPPAPRVTG